MEMINSVSDNVNLLEKQVNVTCTCSVVTGEPYCTEEWQVRVPPKIVLEIVHEILILHNLLLPTNIALEFIQPQHPPLKSWMHS